MTEFGIIALIIFGISVFISGMYIGARIAVFLMRGD
jgi:hypothetical protein